MPKAAAQDKADHDRFEDMLVQLPQVRSGMPESEWRYSRHWWFTAPAFPEPRNRDEHTANYTYECLVGGALAENMLRVLRNHPEHAGIVISATLRDMVEVGRLSGVEIAFINRLTDYLFVRMPGVTREHLTVVNSNTN